MKNLAPIVQLFTIFVLPILLLFVNIIPPKYSLYVLAAITLISIIFAYYEKWSLQDFGLHFREFKKSVVAYIIFTTVICMLTLVLAKILNKSTLENWWTYSHFQYQFLIISVAQEVIYRGFLLQKLKLLFGSVKMVILINAFLFALLHILFPNPIMSFATTFLLGVGFAGIYYRFPSLILISISHAVINFVSLLHCFVNPYCS